MEDTAVDEGENTYVILPVMKVLGLDLERQFLSSWASSLRRDQALPYYPQKLSLMYGPNRFSILADFCSQISYLL